MPSNPRLLLRVYAAAIFLSAALLFAVQPMFTKMVLPKLGGSPSVWSVAMVFFQAVLRPLRQWPAAASLVRAYRPSGSCEPVFSLRGKQYWQLPRVALLSIRDGAAHHARPADPRLGRVVCGADRADCMVRCADAAFGAPRGCGGQGDVTRTRGDLGQRGAMDRARRDPV